MEQNFFDAITPDVINTLGQKEILAISNLVPFAEAARKVELLIRKNPEYSFKIGEESIMIWRDSSDNEEYITRDGVWKGKYFGRKYEVNCNAEEIFKLAKASYLIRRHLVPEYEEGHLTEYGKAADTWSCFKHFVKRIVSKDEELRKLFKD